MRFCPQCGTPVVAGAKFCVECGAPLSGSASFSAAQSGTGTGPAETPVELAGGGREEDDAPGASRAGKASVRWQSEPGSPAPPRFNLGFLGVFGAILLIGLGTAAFILRAMPAHERVLAAAAAARDDSLSGSMASSNLPPGHPQVVKLPAEAVKFITQVKAKAEAAPKDVAAWNRLGDVAERAGMFDSSYYVTAQRAYAHALTLDPNNLDALRGVGNLDYDRRHYDEAIAAYEHYLQRKPDDPRVRTDLGTMYLSSGENDLAMVEYRKVIAKNPKFFEAYFNMGVAYAEEGNGPQARSYFLKARTLAPDDRTRGEINQMLAQVGGAGSETAVAAGAGGSDAASASAIGSSGTFHGEFEQMARALPIAGPKVQSVQWTGADTARLMMRDFPMDNMPPFAATRFLEDLRSNTRDAMRTHHVKGPVTIEIVDTASNHVMQSVTVDAAAGASAPAGTSVAAAEQSDRAAGGPADGAANNTASAGAASPGTFQDAVANMMRNLPVAGPKVTAVQWPSKTRAKVVMNDFPMNGMPPFMRAKFNDDIKAGLESAKAAHKVTGIVTVDIADEAGHVMDSVSK